MWIVCQPILTWIHITLALAPPLVLTSFYSISLKRCPNPKGQLSISFHWHCLVYWVSPAVFFAFVYPYRCIHTNTPDQFGLCILNVIIWKQYNREKMKLNHIGCVFHLPQVEGVCKAEIFFQFGFHIKVPKTPMCDLRMPIKKVGE